MVFFVWHYFYQQIQVQTVIFPDCYIIYVRFLCNYIFTYKREKSKEIYIDNIGLVIYNKDSSTENNTYVSRRRLFFKKFFVIVAVLSHI